MDLEAATRAEGSEGAYRIALTRQWEAWGPNGGYLAAIALRAAGMMAEIRRPTSFSALFIASPEFDSVDLKVQLLKRGRRSEALGVDMQQHGKPILRALVRTAADAPGFQHQQIEAPTVPAPEGLRPERELMSERGESWFPVWDNFDVRPTAQLPQREPSAAIRRDWVRFEPRSCFDDPFVDAARALILLDTYAWLAAYRSYPNPEYFAPNFDVAAWFHQLGPQAEWLLIDHACPIAGGGLMGAHGHVWDAAGTLLASGSAHLCCLPIRRE